MTEPAPPKRRRRRRLWLLLAFVAVLVSCYLGRAWLFAQAAHFLDVSEPPRKVDAILVLGGGINDRPFAAAAIYRAGLADRVLHSTVGATPDAEDGLMPPEHEIVRGILLKRGVPSDRIVLLPGPCWSTIDEAKAIASYLDEHPDTQLAVVTHAFHTRRTRVLLRRTLGERVKQVTFFAAPNERYTPEQWWRTEDGAMFYVSEYLKLALTGSW